MERVKINVRNYVSDDTTILSYRPKGIQAREQAALNAKDKDTKEYEVIIDNDFKSLNSSFWLGMFGDSVRTLSEDKFREKYKFTCKDVFLDKIDQCIEIISKRG